MITNKNKWEKVKLKRLTETKEEKEIRFKRQRENSKRYRIKHPDRVIKSRKIAKSKPDFKRKQTEYYLKNKERIIKNSLYQKYVSRYGITRIQYKEQCITQNNKCLICKIENILVVDHCHKTNKFRGLICRNCNFGLGFFNDDMIRLKNAITYLTKFTKSTQKN